MTVWLDIHKEFDLLWSLICSDVLLSVYSPLRIQAYVNQLKSKYKMTIDIFIVRAWFKESILKLKPVQWLQFSDAFLKPLVRATVCKIIHSSPVKNILNSF